MIQEIDGLRFVAIFPVVIQHLSERLERNVSFVFNQGLEFEIIHFITNRGFIGVYIFFALSGFILGLPFAAHLLKNERKVSIRSYFIRRLTRLEPPYIIVVTLVACSLIFMNYYTLAEIAPHYGASIVYLHSILFHSWSFINPPVWTLEIEVQFYILAPFLALLLFRIKGKILRRGSLLFLLLLILILQQNFKVLHQWYILTIVAHLHFFLLGFILADIYLVDWAQGVNKKGYFNYLSMFALVALLLTWSWEHFLLNRILFSFSLFLLIYSVFRATWINRFITYPWITAIGGMCYTIYLIHLPLIELFIRVTKNVHLTDFFSINFLLQLILLTPVLLLSSIFFFLLVEKPCMKKDWPQRLVVFVKKTF